jgi:hypothetical protein
MVISLFLTCGKEKKTCYKVPWLIFLHTVLLNMSILELLMWGWWWCELVHLVPMFTVDWLCHSLLLVELFIDTFTLFPTGTVWLGCPFFGSLACDSGCTYAQCTHITMVWVIIIHTHRYKWHIHISIKSY